MEVISLLFMLEMSMITDMKAILEAKYSMLLNMLTGNKTNLIYQYSECHRAAFTTFILQKEILLRVMK